MSDTIVGGSETTSVSPTNPPTNQPPPTNSDPPSEYISIRITLGHHEWARIVSSVLFDCDKYIAYPHTGKSGENPHWHILILTTHIRDGERYRKRIKSSIGTGNESYSIKRLQNGLLSGIQYCSRESSRPMVAGSDMQHWVNIAPAWVDRTQPKLVSKPSKERLGDPTLTLTNVVKQAVKYANHNDLDCNLTNVLHHMASHGWVPSRDIIAKGLPRAVHDEFDYRMSRRVRAPHLWMYPTDPTPEQLRWREEPDTSAGIFHDPGLIQTGTLTI